MRRLALLAIVLLAPSLAAAQYELAGPEGEPTDAELEQARTLYVRAGGELEAARWADAADLYAQSYRLSGVGAALFNHATALRALGRHRDARDAFRQLLREHPDLPSERREEAEARMREEAGRVALVLVGGLEEAPEARLTFDGATVTALEHPVQIETDAGDHAVGVDREGFEPWRRALTLEDGQRESVQVALVPLPGEDATGSAILWTIVGVLVIGGAIAGGILGYEASQHAPEEPYDRNVVRL